MCNICVNSLVFTSRDLTKLKDLHNKIKKVSNNKRDNSLARLLLAYSYNQEKIHVLVDKRDYFSDVHNSITQKGSVYYFMAETCSAWEENLLGLHTILKEKYNDAIRMYHQSEEEGLALYSVFDPTGLFFNDRYKVDMCLNNEYTTEYFSSYGEVVEMLQSYFPTLDISVFDAPADVETTIRETLNDDGEDFFNIHVFQPYGRENWCNNYYKEAA